MTTFRALLIAFITASVITGCGYRLQGQHDAVASDIRVQVIAQDDSIGLKKAVKQQMQGAQGNVVATLTIVSAQVERRPLSYDSGVAAAQYNVEMIAWVNLVDVQGKELATMQPLQVNRVYSYDRNFALAKENEQREIEAELLEALANQITRFVKVSVAQ